MTRRLAFLVALALALAPLGAVGAQQMQQIPRLRPGDRIRLEAHDLKGEFKVVEWTESNRRVREIGSRFEPPVLLDSIRRLEVRRAKESRARSALRGGALGLAIGAAVGAAIGYASGDDSEGTFLRSSAGNKAALAGGALGSVCLVIGAVAGAGNPRGRWERLIPPPSVGLVRPPGGGTGITVQRAF